jgi:uncharacterized protein YcaQ
MIQLDNTLARRLFLHLHALGEERRGAATGEDLAALIDRIGFVQVDSIATVERAHHMILWSRRQSYRPEALKSLIETDCALWEHWTHDASILPMAVFPHWRHRFQRSEARMQANWQKWFRPGFEKKFETILERIRQEGALKTSDVGQDEERSKGGWWDWHPSKTALEWLWRTGKLVIARREGFHKVYDLTERVVPAALLAKEVETPATVAWAMRAALDHLGFGTSGELAAYYDLVSVEDARGWVKAALVAGEIEEVMIESADGALRKSFARPGLRDLAEAVAEPPGSLRVLSPFDPALRDRKRAEFLFGFHYRIEVFVPEPKRIYGYYVFPVLEGDRLVGRLDAKAFRTENTLRVKAYWPEAGLRTSAVRLQRLEAEIALMARFAGCEQVSYSADWIREPLRITPV